MFTAIALIAHFGNFEEDEHYCDTKKYYATSRYLRHCSPCMRNFFGNCIQCDKPDIEREDAHYASSSSLLNLLLEDVEDADGSDPKLKNKDFIFLQTLES